VWRHVSVAVCVDVRVGVIAMRTHGRRRIHCVTGRHAHL